MKLFIINALLILASFSANAQSLSAKLKQAFKTDDVSLFNLALKEDKIVIDSLFTA